MRNFKRIPKNLLLALGLVKPLSSSFKAFLSLVLDTPFNVMLAPVYSLSFAGTDFVLLHPDHMKVTIINKKNKACLIESLLFELPLFASASGIFPLSDYSLR